MQIRSQIFLLVFVTFALWIGSLLWLGQTAHGFYASSNQEVQRTFQDEERIAEAMKAFQALESLRGRAVAMTEWFEPSTARAEMEAYLDRFHTAIGQFGEKSAWRRSNHNMADVLDATFAWESGLRNALGFGDGRFLPIHHALDQQAATLQVELEQLLRLFRGATADSLEGQRDELTRLLTLTVLGLTALTLFAACVVVGVCNGVARRFGALETSMRRMASGDLDFVVEDVERNDEIGKMAAALDVFHRTGLEARKLEERAVAVERRLIEERAEAKFLQLSLAKEREINSLQRRFVSMVSHEFRTPLAIIDGTVQRVLRGAHADGIDTKMARVRAAVKRLTNLIESVLSVATLDEGKIALNAAPCDPRRLLTEIAASQEEISSAHVIALELDALPPSIEADAALLTQVFTNLLSNAVKYSPEGGGITLSAAHGDDWVEITVADSGVGVPADELPLLFTRFFRARTSTGITGSGIGLNLVRALVEMHGGAITVESVEGEGSRFTVRLPVSQAGACASDPEPAAA